MAANNTASAADGPEECRWAWRWEAAGQGNTLPAHCGYQLGTACTLTVLPATFEQLLRDLEVAGWLKGDAEQVVPGWTDCCDELGKLREWRGWTVEGIGHEPGVEAEDESTSPARLRLAKWYLEGRLICPDAVLDVHHLGFFLVQHTCLLP